MKYSIVLIAFILSLFSCKKDDSDMKSLQDKLDSISIQLEELKNESKTKSDSISKDTIQKPDERKKTIRIPYKEKLQITKKEKPIKLDISSNDTIYHYFSDGRISVKIAPRSERQKIWMYLPNGEVIYELENIRLSYSCYNELVFRKNGSVEKVISSLNPGASMYMYKTIIHFDERNEPLYKIDEKTPSTLEEHVNNKSLWDSKNRRWIKQEIIYETITPSK
jgi:hypothetical protein